MDSLVEQEFAKIKSQMGRQVTVVEVSRLGEGEPLTGILEDFTPFSAVEISLGSGGNLAMSQACAFIGAMSGIRKITDAEGNEIYRNNNPLHWEDRFYDPFQNKEDNKIINAMRRAKFGEGHDYEMFEGCKTL